VSGRRFSPPRISIRARFPTAAEVASRNRRSSASLLATSAVVQGDCPTVCKAELAGILADNTYAYSRAPQEQSELD